FFSLKSLCAASPSFHHIHFLHSFSYVKKQKNSRHCIQKWLLFKRKQNHIECSSEILCGHIEKVYFTNIDTAQKLKAVSMSEHDSAYLYWFCQLKSICSSKETDSFMFRLSFSLKFD